MKTVARIVARTNRKPQNTLHTHQPCETMASNADQAMNQAFDMGHTTEGELLENFDKLFSEL